MKLTDSSRQDPVDLDSGKTGSSHWYAGQERQPGITTPTVIYSRCTVMKTTSSKFTPTGEPLRDYYLKAKHKKIGPVAAMKQGHKQIQDCVTQASNAGR